MKRADDTRHLDVLGTEEVADPGTRWLPEGHDPALAEVPRETLRYVVVDDLYDDGVLLISYLWPSLTAAGTLFFGDDQRLSSLPDDAWADTASGMPLVFMEGDAIQSAVVPLDADTSARMPRATVQEAVDVARLGGDPAGFAAAGDDEPAPELTRPLRIGDTFAVVITSPDQVDVVAGGDAPPTERIPLGAARLTDITRQARTVAKAAQLSALSPPKRPQQLEDEIVGSAAQASAWELESDVEISVEDTGAEDVDTDPRDAQPTV